jgi:hypothetical protein
VQQAASSPPNSGSGADGMAPIMPHTLTDIDTTGTVARIDKRLWKDVGQ